jgi:tRNA threonylcarbamoyladenosine biosynthesis protein TsaB
MTILHIESSSKNCSVAISKGAELLCLCEETAENFQQSEKLHQFIQWALQGAEIGTDDIDAICLGDGPGSYTGLRIGAAAAKGLSFALDKPLLAHSSMASMALATLSDDYDLIIPLLDARRMEVYTAVYHAQTGELLSPIQALVLQENSFEAYAQHKVLFVGDGCPKTQSLLAERYPNFSFKAEVEPSAQYFIAQAIKKFEAKDFEDLAYYEPNYLKAFNSHVQ